MVTQPRVSTDQLERVIRMMPDSFTVLDFRQAFEETFPHLWQQLVQRYELYGSGTRYSALTYLSNRLSSYSRRKRPGLLEPTPKGWKPEESRHLRHSTAEERQHFGSPLIVVYWRRRSS
jgi:hypothetical protein